MKRRLISVLLSTAMTAALLAGCGQAEQTSGQESGTAQESDAAESSQTEESADTSAAGEIRR